MSEFNGCRALLIEDEMLVAMLIEDALVEAGCKVVGPISRVADALRALDETEIDFAVLDVNLGGETSYPIADALAARKVPFTFITGYASLDSAYARFPCLHKPFSSGALEQHIMRIWRSSG
jgi:two-component SAPR family response regulator